MAARATLLTYLSGQLHPLAVRLTVAETDQPDGYGYALDSTLARMGVTTDPNGDGDLPPALWPAARAVARYYGLVTLQARAAAIDAPPPPPNWPADRPPPANPIFTRIAAMIAEAEKEAQGLGYPIGLPSAAGFTLGQVYLDYRNARPPAFIRGRRMSIRGWG